MTEQPLLILADTYKQACLYAVEHDLGPESARRWRYVRGPQDVHGRRGGKYVHLGIPEPHEPAMRWDAYDTLQRNGFTPIEEGTP